MFKNTDHVMYNECNKLHEYFDTIHLFAKGETAAAGRLARETFTDTNTIPKKKKRKRRNTKTDNNKTDSEDDSEDDDDDLNDNNKNKNKNKTAGTSRISRRNNNNANNSNNNNSSSLDFDSFRCNYQTHASPTYLNRNISNDKMPPTDSNASTKRNKNKQTLPYISDGDQDDIFGENTALSTMDGAKRKQQKDRKSQKKSKKKTKGQKKTTTTRKKATKKATKKKRKKDKSDSDSEFCSESSTMAKIDPSKKRRSQRIMRQNELLADKSGTRGQTPDDKIPRGSAGDWLNTGPHPAADDEQYKEQKMDYDAKLDKFEVSVYVYLFIFVHIFMYLWLSFMIIIVIYVKKSIEESITFYKDENPLDRNFRFENIPKKRLLEMCHRQWGLFLPFELGNYIMSGKICPLKPRSLGGQYIVDDDHDIFQNYPAQTLLSKLKTIELLKEYGNKLPSEISNNIDLLRSIPELDQYVKVWSKWCLQHLFQNKTHYCTSWCAIDGKPDTYGV